MANLRSRSRAWKDEEGKRRAKAGRQSNTQQWWTPVVLVVAIVVVLRAAVWVRVEGQIAWYVEAPRAERGLEMPSQRENRALQAER